MISVRKSLRGLCLVLSALVLSAFAAPAGGFNGTIGAPVIAGKRGRRPVSLALANQISSDKSNTTIALQEPTDRVTYGRVNGLFMPAGAKTHVDFPQGVYDSWQRKVLRS